MTEHGLAAHLIGADRLHAVSTGSDSSPVEAKDAVVLVDADTVSWSSWNLYGAQFARHVGAEVVRIDDGGVTGPAFFDHVRRLRRPVLNSPKGQTNPVPPDLVVRPVVGPAPYWTWSLVARSDDTRSSVQAVVKALTSDIGTLGLDDDTGWLPANDPHRLAR
jgi:hypothetical protein